MYYMIFKDDDGRLVVKDKSFVTKGEAKRYAMSISLSRNPCVVYDVIMSDYNDEY